ncbi:hypothetical protein I4U23_029400 [Adineta vaga]|nr:hypothetical protein I4U23_029400 [Adineta vaga]
MKYLLLIFLSIATISSLPTTPIRRNIKSPSCIPNACIIEPAFCICGFEESPNDPCCEYKCSSCPADFTFPWMTFEIGSLNFFPLGTMNFSEVNWNLLGRR